MLTCDCEYLDPDHPDFEGWFQDAEDFCIMQKETKCSSCNKTIQKGEIALEFERFLPEFDEFGDMEGERQIPSVFTCEKCGEIFLNLTAIGYCLDPEMNMNDALEEYWEIKNFVPTKKDNISPSFG